MSGPMIQCLRCCRTRVIHSRGLCKSCYNVVERQGHLDDYPLMYHPRVAHKPPIRTNHEHPAAAYMATRRFYTVQDTIEQLGYLNNPEALERALLREATQVRKWAKQRNTT